MTSVEAATQVEAGMAPGTAEHSSSVNGARSLGTELMELFVLKQADEVSLSRTVRSSYDFAWIASSEVVVSFHNCLYRAEINNLWFFTLSISVSSSGEV